MKPKNEWKSDKNRFQAGYRMVEQGKRKMCLHDYLWKGHQYKEKKWGHITIILRESIYGQTKH